MLSSALAGVQYTYDTDLIIYTKNVDGTIIHSDTEALTIELMKKYAGFDMSSMLAMRDPDSYGQHVIKDGFFNETVERTDTRK